MGEQEDIVKSVAHIAEIVKKHDTVVQSILSGEFVTLTESITIDVMQNKINKDLAKSLVQLQRFALQLEAFFKEIADPVEDVECKL